MRNTYQTAVVIKAVKKLNHTTNRQLWNVVKQDIPDITLTSIHRITQRLRLEGYVGCLPTFNGENVIDANPLSHSHFLCRQCNKVENIVINESIIKSIHNQLNHISNNGILLIVGNCCDCQNTQLDQRQIKTSYLC